MRKFLVFGLAAVSLAACDTTRHARVDIDEVRFRVKVHADEDDKRDFLVTVTPAAAPRDSVLDAARYGATKYCLLNFGGSDTEWRIGPDTPWNELAVDGNMLTLAGRCTQR